MLYDTAMMAWTGTFLPFTDSVPETLPCCAPGVVMAMSTSSAVKAAESRRLNIDASSRSFKRSVAASRRTSCYCGPAAFRVMFSADRETLIPEGLLRRGVREQYQRPFDAPDRLLPFSRAADPGSRNDSCTRPNRWRTSPSVARPA